MIIYYNESCLYVITILLIIASFFSVRFVALRQFNRYTLASFLVTGLLGYELWMLGYYLVGYVVPSTIFYVYALKLGGIAIYFYEMGKDLYQYIYETVWATPH